MSKYYVGQAINIGEEKNNYAHEKMIVKDYSELKELIPSGENNYVVVMTFGYRTDDIAVRALMQKQFKYFGLLGSKKKIEKMFEDYRKDGMDGNVLQQIHSPIGMQIKSQTPEEIAISNAAEIIKAKNFRLAFFILNYISFYRRVIIFDLSVYNYLIKVTFYTGCNIHIFYILNMKVQMRLR